MRIRTIIATAAAPAALAAVLLGTAGQASAATTAKPVTITANTHLNNHPDTTSLISPVDPSQQAVVNTPDGPVWAYDNATEKFTLVQQSDDTWRVTVDYVGSFHGFADPKTGAALDSNGSVKGTITFTVTATSNAKPDPANLPGQSASDAHLTDNIKALFGGNASVSGGDQYSFSYQNGNYVQNTAGTTGDVTGH